MRPAAVVFQPESRKNDWQASGVSRSREDANRSTAMRADGEMGTFRPALALQRMEVRRAVVAGDHRLPARSLRVKIGASRLAIGNAIRLMCRRAITSQPPSGCGHRSKGSHRQSLTGPTISTPSPGKSWAGVSIISARKVRSWSRRRLLMIPTRTKPICGRSSSGAGEPTWRVSPIAPELVHL
jgi:hypothetical protein